MTELRSASQRSRVGLWVACGAFVVGACAQATTRSAAGSGLKLGRYHFEDYNRGNASRIQGTVTLFADTAAIDLDVGYCLPSRRLFGDDGAAVFQCDGAAPVSRMRVSIDRWDPEQGSSWSGRVPTTTTSTTCTAYNTLPTGERICSKYQTESQDRDAPVGGRLRVVRVAP